MNLPCAHGLQFRGHQLRRADAGTAGSRSGHGAQPAGILQQVRDLRHEAVALHAGLGQHQGRAFGHQGLGVARLMVMHRIGERHQHRGQARGAKLGHGGGPGAAKHQIRPGIGRSHVVDEGTHTGRVIARRRIGLAGHGLVTHTGLVAHFDARGPQGVEMTAHMHVQGMGPQGPPHDQQALAGKIMLPSVTYIVSLCVNVFCNATFIFGLFGLPKLGVTGVALGTVIARISEVLICLIYSLRSADVRFRIKYFFAKSDILLQDFIKIATPAVINDVVWSFANSAFAAILGHIGDDMVAANAVAVMVVNIGAIACRGFANATTIIVSQELGKDRIDTAREYGKRMLTITFIVSLIGCVVILAIRPIILDFYRDKLTETAIYYLGIFIIMTTWRFVGEGINTCLICGCFRGGGDSRFGMIIDSLFMWLVAVPLTFLAAYVFKLPPVWVYFVMTLDEFEKMPVVFIHYFRNKWLTNITRDFE